MKQESKQESSSPKKPYLTPNLVEYGTVAKLTQALGGSGGDGRRTRIVACL